MATPAPTLFVLSAPSGAGKTTLVRALTKARPALRFSISYTTRARRPNEVHGVDYFFVTEPVFRAMAAAGDFLEYASVFDHHYGTSRRQIESQLASGHSVILEIDWQGARQVRDTWPDATTIFILPPDQAELSRRLRGRGTDSEAVIQRRLEDSLTDMGHWDEFDFAVVNGDLEQAAGELVSIIDGGGEGHRTAAPETAARAARALGG